jgi:pyrroloquinoline quinone biosynthesis protein B
MARQMRVQVLGSSAGGGLPQWNCGCENCTLVRAGDARIAARTQDSIAIGSNGGAQLLVNASPDIPRHIERFQRLWPRGSRDTPIAAIALTNGDLDHVVGLLSLRESQPLRILATSRVRSGLVERNAVLRTLARTPDQVTWTSLEPGREVVLDDVGVGVTAVPVAGKLPVHLVGLLDPSPEDNVALRVRNLASGRTAVIATAVGSLEGVEALVAEADAVFFDGTFWRDDELIALGLGRARAQDMAHVPVGGEDGSIARLARAKLADARRVFTHINNTNPVLRADSPERAEVERAGWEIAFDGMEVVL